MGVWVMPGPCVPAESTGDDADQGAAVCEVSSETESPRCPGSAAWSSSARRQVHPELDAVKQAAATISARAGARCARCPRPAVIHWVAPFVIDAAAADGVLVLESPVDHVGHGLEAPVRVPRGAFGLARCVLDLTHLVHVDERVEVRDPRRRRPFARETLSLQPARGGGDGRDASRSVGDPRVRIRGSLRAFSTVMRAWFNANDGSCSILLRRSGSQLKTQDHHDHRVHGVPCAIADRISGSDRRVRATRPSSRRTTRRGAA